MISPLIPEECSCAFESVNKILLTVTDQNNLFSSTPSGIIFLGFCPLGDKKLESKDNILYFSVWREYSC